MLTLHWMRTEVSSKPWIFECWCCGQIAAVGRHTWILVWGRKWHQWNLKELLSHLHEPLTLSQALLFPWTLLACWEITPAAAVCCWMLSALLTLHRMAFQTWPPILWQLSGQHWDQHRLSHKKRNTNLCKERTPGAGPVLLDASVWWDIIQSAYSGKDVMQRCNWLSWDTSQENPQQW